MDWRLRERRSRYTLNTSRGPNPAENDGPEDRRRNSFVIALIYEPHLNIYLIKIYRKEIMTKQVERMYHGWPGGCVSFSLSFVAQQEARTPSMMVKQG